MPDSVAAAREREVNDYTCDVCGAGPAYYDIRLIHPVNIGRAPHGSWVQLCEGCNLEAKRRHDNATLAIVEAMKQEREHGSG